MCKCKGSPYNRPLRPRGWVDLQPYPFMTSALRWGWVVSATSRPLYARGKTRYPLYRRMGRPQGRSGRVRKISPSPGFDPRTVQPVASRYTDWATRPPQQCIVPYNLIFTFIAVKRKDFEMKGSEFSTNLLCSYFLCKYGFNLLVAFPNIWNFSNFKIIYLPSFIKILFCVLMMIQICIRSCFWVHFESDLPQFIRFLCFGLR